MFRLSLFLTLSISTLYAQHIVGSVTVGDEPRGVAVNSFTGNIYVANVSSGTISILQRRSLIATLPVDTLPYVVAVNSHTNRIYAAGCNFRTGGPSMVVVIDGHTNQVITNIELNQFCGLGTQGIDVNPFTNRVYVSDYDDNQEVVIDGATNQIVARVDLQGRQPVGVAVDLPANQEWVALDGPDGKVDILDGSTNTILETITVTNGFVNNIAINPSTRRAYVVGTSPSSLYVLSTQTRKVVDTLPIGLFDDYVGLDSLANLIFVADGQGNQVFVVDGRTNKVRAVVPVTAAFPAGLAANPVTKFVYVSGFESNQVNIISEQ